MDVIAFNNWLPTINFFGLVIVFVFNLLSHIKITGNDLTHLDENVKKISSKQEKQDETLGRICEDIAYLKGKNDTESKIIEILDKRIK